MSRSIRAATRGAEVFFAIFLPGLFSVDTADRLVAVTSLSFSPRLHRTPKALKPSDARPMV
jgi:hypothetical protein